MTPNLRFVMQQHHATHMHWDFRLEMDGVLVSWAVPKGPSTDPSVKRLAIRVNDHEYSYRNFEGIIAGNHYGSGKVIIWDEGQYCPHGVMDTADLHNSWLEQGVLEFTLYGSKLKGLWSIFRTKNRLYNEDSWLLVKKKDAHADAAEITRERPESVRSGKTVEQVTEEDGCLGSDSWD
jgi:bifunctional non-homologous end joining protein LigD